MLILSTRRNRIKFEVEYKDGEAFQVGTFEVSDGDELPISVSLKIGKIGNKLASLGEHSLMDIPDVDAARLSHDIRASARALIRNMPEHVFDQISDLQLVDVLNLFRMPQAK